MTSKPSQPAPERPAPGPVSSEALDALPAPESPSGAAERGKGEHARVITRERTQPPEGTGPRENARPAAAPADPAGRLVPDANDHRLAMLSYLGVPFLGPVIPLSIYLIKKRASAFVRYHSAQALNLSITALLYTICVLILGTMLALDSIDVALVVGVTLAAALWLATLSYVILAGSRANRGRSYRIPAWLCATIVR
jgi:uncharacterized Tic20 family protein